MKITIDLTETKDGHLSFLFDYEGMSGATAKEQRMARLIRRALEDSLPVIAAASGAVGTMFLPGNPKDQ